MIILIKIFLAHIIADFILQPKKWVEDKEEKKIFSKKFYYHILIHNALLFLFLWDFNLWLPIIIITSSHLIIDLIKIHFQNEKSKIVWFLIDQILHIIVILIVWFSFFSINNINFLIDSPLVWLYSTAIIFLSTPVGFIIKVLLSSWTDNLSLPNDYSLTQAGKYIGILERILIFIFITTGNIQGVGFLIAAKSVFRFGDLKESKDRKLTEYILIGTLLSFGIAITISLLVVHFQ